MRTAVISLIAVGLHGCGGTDTAVSTTGSGVTDRQHAPTVQTGSASRTATGAEIPAAVTPHERVLFLKAGSVWSMSAAGEDVHEITVRATSAPDSAPTLAPRGGSFAFSSARDGVSKIYLANLGEGVPRAITDGTGGGDRSPAWSPDGQEIAFVRGDPARGRVAILKVAAEGGEPQIALALDNDNPELAGMPAWSPDGHSILFAADFRRNQGTLLWLATPDGVGRQPLTPARQGAWFIRDRNPVWSPDGTSIAFASNRHVSSGDHADDYDIYTIRADGTGLTRLTEDPGVADEPAYSPDGKRLFFSSTRDTNNPYEVEIYVMPAEGGDQRRMTRDERPQNRSPSAGLTR